MKSFIAADKSVRNAKIAILRFTFRENCPDTRNTKIIDIVKELREYGIESVIADPEADAEEDKKLYGMEFVDISLLGTWKLFFFLRLHILNLETSL